MMKKKQYKILFILIMFFSWSRFSYADNEWVTCARTSGYYQYFDSATVSVGKDAEVGDLLGTWLTASNPTAWTCHVQSSYEGATISMGVQGYPPYTAYGTTTVDGDTYTIYSTAVKTGLGYIARWRFTVDGETSDWYPLTVSPGTYQTPSELFNANTDDSDSTWNIGVDVQIRFVKTSDSLTSGTTSAFDPMYMRTYREYNGSTGVGSDTYMIAEFLSGGLTIDTTSGTCTTSDVNVDLGDISRSSFTGVGTTAGRTDFNLTFADCPSGLSGISYILTPTTDIVDSGLGTFDLDSTSTATGVVLQLLTDEDEPVSFDTSYSVTHYDSSSSNASYNVPLRAGLYQTDEDVTSGSVSGSVTFTLSYK